MPEFLVALLLSIGCASSSFTASNGTRFVVWVCPPPIAAPATPSPEPGEPT